MVGYSRQNSSPPLVLVHGLWDSPRLFNPLRHELGEYEIQLLAPYLPHRLGAVPLTYLAEHLDSLICKHFGNYQIIDLLGFSMGGVIGRIWLQNLDGAARTRRFFSVGSPQRGTLTAQWVSSWMFAGIADMKIGSSLLRSLNADTSTLNKLKCVSFFCYWDLIVFPGWNATLPCGEQYAVPVLTHKQLLHHPVALKLLGKLLRQP